ncbi:MAG TPA: D-alanyl-D-alanine carboxypeptidase/D-alanyl-D-alanine-endopeptidase [Polyangia bacterium]|nr:D-alanyl-D-alanine carboxypeptidase/D-alanyl-D-alanine-endopeptidase [Polyangia bacterium]
MAFGWALGLAAASVLLGPRGARGDNPPRLLPNPYPGGAPATDPDSSGPPPRPAPGGPGRPMSAAELARPPKDPTARRDWLRARLDELFGAAWLAKSKVSVLVVESDTGRPIYARGDKTLLNTASNVKIVTSAAALSLLGPEYRWKTTTAVAGAAQGPPLRGGGEVAGDLYLRGGGDPALTTEDLSGIAADLAAVGLHKVRGAIVVDDSFFDGAGAHLGPGYDQKSESYASRAPSSAASLNGNAVAVTIVPATAAGAPARVVIEPASPYFTVGGRVITAGDGPAAPTVETVSDSNGRTRVVVAGRVRLGSEPRTYLRRVIEPPLYLGWTLKQILERRGISVAKGVRAGPTPAQGVRVLSTHESPPLGVVVHDLNKRSSNFAAEQVIRTLGAEIVGKPGTWDKGIDAVSRYLANAGLRRGGYQMTSGAGMYDSNRFSAEQIVAVLRAAQRDFRISAEFLASLAVAGTDGTIAHRMASTLAERYVRAKTGTLAGTSCLSGFAGSPGDIPLVFSFLMNDLSNPSEARRTQDRAAELLVAYIEGAN